MIMVKALKVSENNINIAFNGLEALEKVEEMINDIMNVLSEVGKEYTKGDK